MTDTLSVIIAIAVLIPRLDKTYQKLIEWWNNRPKQKAKLQELHLAEKSKTIQLKLEPQKNIQACLAGIVITGGFDNCSFINPHNGHEAFNGVSFLYATTLLEATRPGEKPRIGDVQNESLIPITPLYDDLKTSDLDYIVSTINDGGSITEAHRYFGTYSAMIFSIFDDPYLGVISCTNNREPKKQLDGKDIEQIRVYVSEIRKEIMKYNIL